MFSNLSHSFDPDMVSKCDPSQLGRHVRIVHEKQRHKCCVCMKLLRENTNLQSMKNCMLR